MFSGISDFNPPPLFKFSTTPQQIGTFEDKPMYLQVINTTINTSNDRTQILMDITGKTLIEVNGVLRCDAGNQLGWIQYPFMSGYSVNNFGSLWVDTQNKLRVVLGTSTYNNVAKGQPMILLVTYYIN